MKTQFIVDSTTDIVSEIDKEVAVVPLTVYFGNEEFTEGIDITKSEFYSKIEQSEELPRTSQPTPDAFLNEFQRIQQNGDEGIVITLSSSFSGTFQSAKIAADGFDSIFILDSNTAAIGTGILTEYAVTLAQTGKSAEEIYNELERVKGDIIIIATVDTLEYLQKGGRISKSLAFAGGILNLKPILCVENGEIKKLGKARGNKHAYKLLIEEIEKAGGIDCTKPFLVGYTGNSREQTDNFLREWTQCDKPIRISQLGSVIGTHVGPGAIAVAFFRKRSDKI